MTFFMCVIWPLITLAIGYAIGRAGERIDNILGRLQAFVERRK